MSEKRSRMVGEHKEEEMSIEMEIDVQPMVGGNIIITFGRVDVELTRAQAEKLKILLMDAIERSERDPFLRGRR